MNDMEVISHLNVAVGMFPFTKILNLEITHSPNTFGRCVIVGQMDSEVADDIANRTDETSMTEVITSAAGQPKRLFCGVVDGIDVSHQAEYAQVTVTLLDTCKNLDRIKYQRSYQITSRTYGDLVKKCMEGEGTATISVTDKRTGAVIIQYDETNWAFSQRMASQLGAPIVSDIRADTPNLYVGLPPSDQTKDLSSSTYDFRKKVAGAVGAVSEIQVSEDLAGAGVESYCYTFIGNFVQIGQRFYVVKSVHATLVDGILTMHYGLLPMGNSQPSAGATTALGSLATAPITNQNCCGKMFTGTVKNVSGSKVQVQFSFDSSFDGDYWFEYSTAYSSSDKTGWYCMPEKGDTVRVFFPSGNEGEAFAASSVPKFAAQDPKDKCWMAHGKQIVLSEKGINISCDEGAIMIDLSVEDGIVIYSSQNISINATKALMIQAGSVLINAENQIALGTDRAFIDITQGKITLLGNEVAIE